MRVLFAFVRAGAVLAAVGLIFLLVPAPRVSSSSIELVLEAPAGAAPALPLEMTRHVREAILDRKTIERLSDVGSDGASEASRIEAASRFERGVEVVSIDGRVFHLLVSDGDGDRATRVSNELAALAVTRAPGLASRACTAPGCSTKARVVEQAQLVAAPMADERWLALGFGVLLALAAGLVPLAIPGRTTPAEAADDEETDESPPTDRLPAATRPASRTLPLARPLAQSPAVAAARPAELARTEIAPAAPPVAAPPSRRAISEPNRPAVDPGQAALASELASPIMGYAVRSGWRADTSLNPEARGALATEFHALSAEQCVVVAVTGTSQRSEAKAKLAVELALSVARSEDRRLLLVEADFRHPAIAGLMSLEVPDAADFTRELTRRGEGAASAALGVLLCTPTLHVLPALPSPSGELVLTTHFEACLRMFRDYYDLVVVHAPEASFGVYATAIADVVDAAVVIGEVSQVPAPFAKKSLLRVVGA
jgi:Mrp family chromosome partitioning ATPase